ncbi:hypothetical protein G6F68_020930 [Rhizopus microsporus]|nr:hypothetical protein G6F68_020930 [Rhizopus microsporus]
MLAELAVLLVVRNPSVSPFYALAVLFYPVFETGFSIWRRRFKRGVPPGPSPRRAGAVQCDGVALHVGAGADRPGAGHDLVGQRVGA